MRNASLGFIGILLILLQMSTASAQDPRTNELRRLPVPNVTVYPGDVLRPELLTEREFYTSAASRSAVHTSIDALVGKVSRRTLISGDPVPVNAVRDAFSVTQGQAVTLIYAIPGLTIMGRGMPLQNGSAGELISLRSEDGGATLKGIVQPDGTVRVER